MERVGHFLQVKANNCAPYSHEYDLFGRSSLNRYYYATYLQVRLLLGKFDAAWAKVPHSSIPDILTGPILRTIKQRRIRSSKIDDKAAVDICNRAAASARALATLMIEAYASRVTADYEPEVPIVPDGQGRFRLNSVPVTTAHDWPTRAQELGNRIERAWRLP